MFYIKATDEYFILYQIYSSQLRKKIIFTILHLYEPRKDKKKIYILVYFIIISLIISWPYVEKK